MYLFLINAAGLLFMLVDKYKAKKKLWRIPENVLIGLALVGGSFGCTAGMYLFRHKTRHSKFAVGLPAILIIHAILLGILLFK